ncbi:MAG: glycogen synthase [Campylobacterota bacterium]
MALLFCTSEMYPYAKSGGLGDVSQSLPEALRNTIDVYTVLPLYQTIDRNKFNLQYAHCTFYYTLNGVSHQFDIFHNKNNRYELFIYNPILCDREGLYYDGYGDFGDNALRFGLFSYACIEVIFHMNLEISAIHINDWQTALIALLAKTKYKLSQKIILTIHNLAYQGIYPKNSVDLLELSWDKCFKKEALEYHDEVNFLKAGIFYSDKITTVSPTYANEIQTKLFGNDLEHTLIANNYKLSGILNGISYEVFNPKIDLNIYKKFTLKNYKNKNENKQQLLADIGFKRSQKPLFIFIGRFTNQKGIDLLIESLNLLKDFEANFIILGSGEKHYETIFNNISVSYPNVYIKVGYEESFSRKLYAAADFLLMPSIFEPCGLNQMIGMKYGVLPIVAKTGGLKDSVVDFTDVDYSSLNEYIGIGITYEEQNIFWFMHAIAKALSLYANHQKFETISKHNMAVDNSWEHSALRYIELYQ